MFLRRPVQCFVGCPFVAITIVVLCAAPGITQTPAPASAACAVPNAPAKVIKAAIPVAPMLIQNQPLTGIVEIAVRLDADSRIVGKPVIRKSLASTYQTEIARCVPVPSTYTLIVDFRST
jgi:hypothetical protein